MKRKEPASIVATPYGLSFFTSEHHPDFYMAPIISNFHKLLWIEEGKGAFNAQEINRKELLYISPQYKHKISDNKNFPLKLCGFCFTEKFLNSHILLAKEVEHLWKAPPCFKIIKPNELFCAEFAKLFNTSKIVCESTEERPLAKLKLFTEALLLYNNSITNSRTEKVPTDFLLKEKIVTEVELCGSSRLRISELCKKLGYNERTLRKKVREIYNSTLIDILHSAMLDIATRLIEKGADIGTAAINSGFYDSSHYLKVRARKRPH